MDTLWMVFAFVLVVTGIFLPHLLGIKFGAAPVPNPAQVAEELLKDHESEKAKKQKKKKVKQVVKPGDEPSAQTNEIVEKFTKSEIVEKSTKSEIVEKSTKSEIVEKSKILEKPSKKKKNAQKESMVEEDISDLLLLSKLAAPVKKTARHVETKKVRKVSVNAAPSVELNSVAKPAEPVVTKNVQVPTVEKPAEIKNIVVNEESAEVKQNISRLQKDLEAATAQLKQKDVESAKFQKLAQEARNHSNILQNEVEKLKDSNRMMSQYLLTIQSSAKETQERLQMEVSQRVAECGKYQRDVQELNVELNKRNSQIKTEQLKLEELRKATELLSSEKVKLSSQINESQRYIDTLRADHARVQQRVRTLEESVHGQNEESVAKVKSIVAERNDFEEKYHSFQSKVVALEAKNKELAQTVAQQAEKLVNVGENINQLAVFKAEVEILKESARKAQEELVAKTTAVEQFSKEVEEFKVKQSESAALVSQVDELKFANATLSKEKANLVQEFTALKAATEALAQELEQSRNKAAVVDQSEELEELKKANEQLKNDKTVLEDQVKEKEAVALQLSSEVENYKVKENDLSEKMIHLEDLHKQVFEKFNETNKQKVVLEEQLASLNDYQNKVKQLEVMNAELVHELGTLKTTQPSVADLQKLEEELSTLKNEKTLLKELNLKLMVQMKSRSSSSTDIPSAAA